jgi:AcrR family transcriptional regulator
MPRPSRRDQLLAAAAEVVRRDGYDRLTLDAVAAEAEVSKGGLLYHFASKQALVAGLVERLLAGFEARLAAAAKADRQERGRFSRAFVRATVAGAGDAGATEGALIAAVALDPALLQPMRERYKAWTKALAADGLDATDALVVRLAVDGLWLADLLGFEPPGGKARAAVVARLLELAGGAAATAAARPGVGR